MTTAFCETLNSAEQRRHASKNETFESLARQVADDANLDPDTVAEQLDELGRTAEELSDAAQLIVDRREWAVQRSKDADLQVEHNRLSADMTIVISVRDAAIQAARLKAAQATTAIEQRLAFIAAERDKIQTSHNRLIETSPHHDRLRQLWKDHGAAIYALQGRLAVELRQATAWNIPIVKGEITRTKSQADQLAAEIARLEREALQP